MGFLSPWRNQLVNDSGSLTNQVIIKQSNFDQILGEGLQSGVEYFVDGLIDLTGSGLSIEYPQGDLVLRGFSLAISGFKCTDNNYTLCTSPVSGSGNIFDYDMFYEISGTNSKVYDIVADTGFEAIEHNNINFNNCTSLGVIDNYRQGLEIGTGRFGGSPELELKGTWVGGYRISTSIVRNITLPTALFKAGAGFVFNGRFFISINADLPATGALLDFSSSNITNDESLIIEGATVTRAGVSDASDITLHPNIDEKNVKCNWFGNVGIPDTAKYLSFKISAEIATTVSLVDTYYELAGTYTQVESSHISMSTNGRAELLSGNGKYTITGNYTLASTANNVLDVRLTKSSDGGSTFPTVVNHISRQVNNIVGGRDVAFFPIDFITTLKKGDILRVEVENKTASNNITAELDSYFIVSKI